MAITDIDRYAHLTEADVEALGAELDAIRRDIEESRGVADAKYIRRTIAFQRALAAGGRVVSTSSPEGEASSSTVLLALPQDHAKDVAAASFSQPLTVVIVGDRAHPQQH